MNTSIVLRIDDYRLLLSYLKGAYGKTSFSRRNAEDLQNELKRARLVNEAHFPLDVVRLNSVVKIKAEDKDDIVEFMLVTPDRANIKEHKISVMAPIGTAVLGFRQGQQVKWQVPAGRKTFTILEVQNNV